MGNRSEEVSDWDGPLGACEGDNRSDELSDGDGTPDVWDVDNRSEELTDWDGPRGACNVDNRSEELADLDPEADMEQGGRWRSSPRGGVKGKGSFLTETESAIRIS